MQHMQQQVYVPLLHWQINNNARTCKPPQAQELHNCATLNVENVENGIQITSGYNELDRSRRNVCK